MMRIKLLEYGMEQTRKEEKLAIALKMLKRSDSLNEIIELTDLAEEQIKALAEQHDLEIKEE